MTRLVTVSWGPDQFRFGPWHGDGSTAYVAVSPRVAAPTSGGVRLLLDRLRAHGFRRVATAALRTHEVAAFEAAGFTERERLVVLSHDLRDIVDAPDIPMRRARRADRRAVLQLDIASFDPAWSLDDDGLAEALAATPRARSRDARSDGPVDGARRLRDLWTSRPDRLPATPRRPSGRAGRRHRPGALVVDSLQWMRHRGGRLVMVNTQQTNTRALDLYRRLGFRTEPSELTVLTRELAS